MKTIASARPYVTAHFAISADARLCPVTSGNTTSPTHSAWEEEIYAGADAILVGMGEVSADTAGSLLLHQDLREALAARRLPPMPLRVIVSDAGTLDPGWEIFHDRASAPVVFSTMAVPDRVRSRLAPLCDLHLFSGAVVPVGPALQILRNEYHVRRAVCAGGATLVRTLAEAGLVDEIFLTLTPVIFGGAEAPSLTGTPGDFLPEAREFKMIEHRTEGSECLLRLRRKAAQIQKLKPGSANP